MVENLNISLNETFSIEEEESFLHNFGTPIHFKKLMEKPVTLPIKSCKNLEDSFDEYDYSPSCSKISDKLKSINISKNKKFEGKDLTNFNFVSPMPSVKRNMRSKPNLCQMDFSKLSPINYASNQNHSSPKIRTECSYIQSTPNQKENIKTKFKSSIRTETKNSQFFTPDKKVSFNLSPDSSLVRCLNRRKVETEKKLTEKSPEKFIKTQDFNEMAKSFEERLKKFASENFKNVNPVKSNQSIEQVTPVVKPETPSDPPKKSTYSPDIRAAFLARRAEREKEIEQNPSQTPSIPLTSNQSNVSLEKNIREFCEIRKKVLSISLACETPQSTKKIPNVTNSVKAKQNMSDRKKFDFATPSSTQKSSRKGIAQTPKRWK